MANAKYLRKRIALVAASALGVGILAAAPAFAISALPTLSGATSTSIAAGAAATTSTAMGFTAGAPSDPATLSAVLTSKPLDSTGTSAGVTYSAATLGTNAASFNTTTGVLVATAAAITAATVPVNFTPDKPGIYVITLTNTAVATATQVWTVYAGTTVDQTHTNTAFAIQGSNVDTTLNLSSGHALTGAPNGQATARFTNFNTTSTNKHYFVTVSGGTLSSVTVQSAASGIVQTNGGTANGFNLTNGSNLSGGVDFWTGTTTTATSMSSALDAQVSAASGTVTIKVSTIDPITGLSTTFSTTDVVFTAVSGYSAALSTLYIGQGATPAASSSTDAAGASLSGLTSGVQAANILASLNGTGGSPYIGQTVSVSIAGPGYVGIAAEPNATTINTTATARTGSVTDTAGFESIAVKADGTTGVATVTVSVTDKNSGATTVLGTKTVTFYGAGTKFAATQGVTIFPVGTSGTDGSSTTPGVTVLVTDANGVAVGGASVYASSATIATATVTASAQTTDAKGKAYFRVTGVAAGTSVLTFGNLATAPTVSTTTTVTVGSSTGTTVTLAFDKASYISGEKGVLTLTVKDASGNPVADGTYTNLFTANLTSSVALGGDSLGTSASPALVGGVKTWAIYAPATVGAFSVNGTTGTAGLVVAAQGKAVTASATVTGSTGGISPAEAAAIAAAKAAADAAIAAVAALSKTVASLVAAITAQIRALSALIKKLLKKRHRR